ncbi:hypothetical protein AAFF_G00188700 [Aldrovandia affinis]|uniref:G-protein coupled receptors family 1 profile domain-containing protein n=1 Tax=Aldrovandia affinis TaxID=143900 RepID=A0AAD7SYY2_9TELE|nr:hypothetical protein AAFF_G00188700 [Aldrovandia affinis]
MNQEEVSPCPICWIQWIVYTSTIAVGLPLNLSALWLLFFKIRRFTETTIYLANLVINDMLLIFSLPFKMVKNITCFFSQDTAFLFFSPQAILKQ